jgi:hypothetical protein
MPIPDRYLRLFAPELEPGETVVSAANADLWLRYRRIALTDRRVLVVERGGLRHPRGGRRVTSLRLDQITGVEVRANRMQHTLLLTLRDQPPRGYALPSFSRGTRPFVSAVQRAAAGAHLSQPLT